MNTVKEKIICCLEKGNWTIKELSQLLDRSPGCIRGTLHRLREEGLVDCNVDISDNCKIRLFYAVSV